MSGARGLAGGAIATLAVAALGCGYADQNPQAARLVARAYLDAYARRDAGAICRLITPPLAASFAAGAGGSCERHVETTFASGEGPLRTTSVSVSERNAHVDVSGQRGRFIALVKWGSIWHVSRSWLLR
jgi:hypothetical protein